MSRSVRTAAFALALAFAAGAAQAAVTDRSAAGFEVRHAATIAAPPHKVWMKLMQPSGWWSSEHSWSGDAKNLSIDSSGCFCERLKHGAVRHMTVIFADEDKALRMEGALGPLQFTGAAGRLGVTLKPVAAGTEVVMTFDAGGYAKGGLAETLAAPVDQVLGAQLARLKKALETGKPD